MSDYRKLDLNSLNFSDEKISFEEAIQDTTPLKISDEVMSGQRKISVTKAEKDYENKCVKLEIFC